VHCFVVLVGPAAAGQSTAKAPTTTTHAPTTTTTTTHAPTTTRPPSTTTTLAPTTTRPPSTTTTTRAPSTTTTQAAAPTAPPTGLGPADFAAAYHLPASSASSAAPALVAVVGAYDDPDTEADLATYRAAYGLPACTTANGCLRKVNESGAASPLPTASPAWGVEQSIDVDMVSAACARCHILVVEASSSSLTDVTTAENTAVALGATVVSNSFGTAEFAAEPAFAAAFTHPGVVVVASSGDSGYGATFPAALPGVVAVGGTTLRKAPGTARGWTETAWAGAGSGCSAIEPKPAWQHDSGCPRRTIADMAAVADPATPVALYDSFGTTGWLRAGGTSVATPLIAGMYGLAGNASAQTGARAAYGDAGAFSDVTSGGSGNCPAAAAYLCRSGPGYDGPTGLGTPYGLGGL